MTHDKLQQSCFVWLWNNEQPLRRLFWSTFNDIKQVEKIIGNIGNKKRSIVLSHMKSLGMVKGVVDFMFYFSGALYIMDFKVKGDRLSNEQRAFIKAIEGQGGKFYEIESLEQFKKIIYEIIGNNP